MVSETQGDQTRHEVTSEFSMSSGALLFLKGVAMGLGDSVPGISGGTVAVITNIYSRFIFAIRAIDWTACKLLLGGHLSAFWRRVDGAFLLLLGLGILTGLLSSASTVLFLLDNYFEALMAFFIGLVMASVYLLKGEYDFLDWNNIVSLVVGFLLTFLLSNVSPRAVDVTLVYVFFSGMVAICAMILPGLSGAFILLLLGVYQHMLTALVGMQLLIILDFAVGCIIGLLAFSRLLGWMLRYYYQLTYGFISGILLGSIFILWPWQRVLSSYAGREGREHPLQTTNVLPLNYLEITGNEPMLAFAALSFMAGVTVVFLLRRASYYHALRK